MPHAPQDPAVREAYQNLIDQTVDQYLALEAAGYQFYFFDPNGPDPYADMEGGFGNPWNAMRDLRANQRMAVYPTADGFGTQEAFDPASNPLLADSGIMWPWGSPDGELRPVTANDLFRAVHDAFGHGLEGAGFRARGEENAWQAHVRLFTGSAIAAITSETRGQNSWLNYGPYGEQNRTAQVQDTIFADQKTGLMPSWTWQEGRAGDMQSQTKEQGDGRAREERTLYQRGIGPDDLRQDGGGAAGRPQGAPIGASAEAALGDAQQPVTAADLDRVDDPEFLRGFLQRPGWAVLTATRENLPESIKDARNAEANAYLRSLLEERGIPFVEVTGSYKGEPQGVSFLIIASEDAAVRLGRQFMQESILTSEGLVYAMRPQPVTPATDEIFVGEGAEAMDFFSETPGGTAFSMGLDFGRGPGQPVIPEGYSERADRPQLPIRPDGLVELIHWSDQPLTSVDPAFAGTGPLNGAERRRGARLSFFGVNPRGNVREQGTGYVKESSLGPVEHVAFVDPDRLYPCSKIPPALSPGRTQARPSGPFARPDTSATTSPRMAADGRPWATWRPSLTPCRCR